MSHIGTDISIIPLNQIGERDQFIQFEQRFIYDQTIGIFEIGNDEIPLGLYTNQFAAPFFDSAHDFKQNFIDTPSTCLNRQNSYKKFSFSFLLHGGYKDLLGYYEDDPALIQRIYSFLFNVKPRPLFRSKKTNLENYFSIGSIFEKLQPGGEGTVQILPSGAKTLNDQVKQDVYNQISTFFHMYKDDNFGQKIKIILDACYNFTDVIKSKKLVDQQREFCILYTAETINDPANKATWTLIDQTFGVDNWYIELLLPQQGY